jgi:AcrR family transcriptional regulator
MLLHHFGSREELLLAIVQEVERRQEAMLDALPRDAAEAFASMWEDVRRPELRPFERLFFECYARAAQGEAPFTRLLPQAIDGWLRAVDDAVGGVPDADMARLGLAVTRGLLLDLAATNDDDAVDRAAARFTQLLRAAGTPPPAASGVRSRRPGRR